MPDVHPVDDLLALSDLHAWYGEAHVLQGMNLRVPKGQLTTLLGRNGAGKTTTLRAVMGLTDRRQGSIRLHGQEVANEEPDDIARRGVGYCPEERGIFAGLTVRENLLLPPVVKPGGMTEAEIYRLFPNLYERRTSQGTKLSGGEQQMLAIARILRTGADLLLLDEPTEGLAPVIVEHIGAALSELKARGFTILMVEQNFAFAAEVSDRFYVVENGVAVQSFDRSALQDGQAVSQLHDYLAV